jgi:hypothetical protein
MATALTIGLAALALWLAGEWRWQRAERARLRADLERGVLIGLYPWLPTGRGREPWRRA